jgi:hypothetical protein
MIMDEVGPQWAEQIRGANAGLPGWQNPLWDLNFNSNYAMSYPMMQNRYLDCWFASTRAMRYEYNLNMLGSGKRVVTNTTTFMTSFGMGHTLGFSPFEEGLDRGWNYSYATMGYNYITDFDHHGLNWISYVDPDTGRSPVNVNTVCNFNNTNYPFYYILQTPYPRALYGVFNIESLRRIIKVGKFYFRNNTQPGVIVPQTSPQDLTAYSEMDARVLYDSDILTNPAKLPPIFDPTPNISIAPRLYFLPPPLNAPIVMNNKADVVREMRRHVEELRTNLAYQYQETLIRYFQACHYTKFQWRWNDPSRPVPSLQPAANVWPYTYMYAGATDNYPTYASRCVGGPEASKVKWFAPTWDNTKARFPYAIDDFRSKVKDDLIAMTVNNNIDPVAGWGGPRYHNTLPKDGGEFVNFDEEDEAEIDIGKLDKRTASAVYDNIVPGKAYLFPGAVPGIKDPIGELYAMRLGRDENTDKDYITNYYEFMNPGNTGNKIAWEKGMDIVLNSAPDGPWQKRAEVPDRQLAFGPDWFSTELTTASTTFAMVIHAQVVDADSVKTSPNNPRVLFYAQRFVVFEIAPDIKVEEVGDDGTSNGLKYYRSNLPRLRKKDPAVMDKNCNYLPSDNGNSTVPKDWIDFRGIKEGDELKYYTAPGQTSRRLVIRSAYDLVQP